MAERDQIFKDLENRVLKVTQLEEELDSEREKRYYNLYLEFIFKP